jgi:hypothetical protein
MAVGRPRTLPDADPRPCAECATEFTPRRKSPGQRFCGRPCQRRHQARTIAPAGSAARRAAAGIDPAAPLTVLRRWPRKDGYVVVRLSDGRRLLEHHWIVEQRDGRPVAPGEVVHHADHDPSNNDPGNLIRVTNQAAHMKHHGKPCASGCDCRRHDPARWNR